MDIDEIKKYKRDIAIILQTEQYKDVNEIDDALMCQIMGFLKDTEKKIDEHINKSSITKMKGAGTYYLDSE